MVKDGFIPDSLSTDLHIGSMNGATKDELNVASKMMAAGLSLKQVVAQMTSHPARQVKRDDLGNLSVGSVADWSLSAKSLDDTKLLESTVGTLMDPPFPTVDGNQSVDAVAKLMSKANPAVLVREDGKIGGIVTRSDMLNYLMGR